MTWYWKSQFSWESHFLQGLNTVGLNFLFAKERCLFSNTEIKLQMMRVQKCAVNDHPASLEKWCLPVRRCPRSRTEVQESCIWAVPRHLCCPSFERPFLTVFWLIIPWWALSSGPKGPYCLLGCIWVQSLNCASTEPVGACLLWADGNLPRCHCSPVSHVVFTQWVVSWTWPLR